MNIDLGGGRTIELVRGNIVNEETDAIVNAANSSLLGGGGVDGAIHRTGGPAILAECRQWVAANGRLPAGRAMATTGGKLRARHVIHTVGPVWRGGAAGEPELLAGCYRTALELAREHRLRSIAFPAISCGVFGYPLDRAATVAVKTVSKFLASYPIPESVLLVAFDVATEQTLKLALRESSRQPSA